MIKQINDIREFQEKIAEIKEGSLYFTPYMEENTLQGRHKRADLRRRLLQEEVDELESAISVADKVEVLDAGVDILYILLGTMHEAGVLDKFSKAWDLIHDNNMTKLDENGKVVKNEFGKVIKPTNYKPVDLTVLFN